MSPSACCVIIGIYKGLVSLSPMRTAKPRGGSGGSQGFRFTDMDQLALWAVERKALGVGTPSDDPEGSAAQFSVVFIHLKRRISYQIHGRFMGNSCGFGWIFRVFCGLLFYGESLVEICENVVHP